MAVTLILRIDLNDNADEAEWVERLGLMAADLEVASYRTVERFSVTVERPTVVWP